MNKCEKVKRAKCGAACKHSEVLPSSYRKPKTMGKLVVEEEMRVYAEYSILKLGRVVEK